MKPERAVYWFCGTLTGLIFLFFFLQIVGSLTPLGGFLRMLPVGWWHFLRRNLPLMTWNWDLIATGAICSMLAILILHWLARRLWRQVPVSFRIRPGAGQWPWRWTICGYLIVWLLFMIAFGSAGILRHSTWLMTYQEPWFREKWSAYAELRIIESEVQMLLMETDSDPEKTRKAFRSRSFYHHHRGEAPEEYNLILYQGKDNKVAAYVIIPRTRPPDREWLFRVSVSEESYSFKPMSELEQTIATLDAEYILNNP